MKLGLALCLALLGGACGAQQPTQAPPADPPGATAQDQTTTTLRTGTSLVLVPALVTTKNSEPVFTLTADDFIVTDDGIPQVLRLEDDSDHQPLALVVLIEAGGSGETHLADYERLGSLVESMIGDVEHTVAVVGFDSEAALVQPFTPNLRTIDEAIRGIGPGDGKAAILDGLSFSVDLLRKQPPKYRRAILMFTETHDHGSHIAIPAALRMVSDTNTAIYSFAYSSTRTDAKEEVAALNSTEPGPEHGCFSREWGGDPSRQPSVAAQDYNCLAELAPPLRLARLAFIAATGALKKNVPETVAKLTGGEYYSFSNEKNLENGMQTLTKHVPNRYVLSFTPKNPHPGLHAVSVTLKDRPNLKIAARSSYWAEGPQ
jgi:VWFA-related protein